MFPTRTRAKIPAIFYLYLSAVIAMTALAASRINLAAGSSTLGQAHFVALQQTQS